MKKLFLLLSFLLLSLTSCFIFKSDFFLGKWKMINEETTILIISKTDSIYNVKVISDDGTFVWEYILSDDGKALKPLENAPCEFKKEGKMLQVSGGGKVGYFKK